MPKKVYESMNEVWDIKKLDENCYVLSNDVPKTKGW